MKIQTVSKYLALAEQGLVSRIDCPIDQGLVMPNLDNEDNMYLYCLSCNYKKIIGLEFYDSLLKEVEKNNGR